MRSLVQCDLYLQSSQSVHDNPWVLITSFHLAPCFDLFLRSSSPGHVLRLWSWASLGPGDLLPAPAFPNGDNLLFRLPGCFPVWNVSSCVANTWLDETQTRDAAWTKRGRDTGSHRFWKCHQAVSQVSHDDKPNSHGL